MQERARAFSCKNVLVLSVLARTFRSGVFTFRTIFRLSRCGLIVLGVSTPAVPVCLKLHKGEHLQKPLLKCVFNIIGVSKNTNFVSRFHLKIGCKSLNGSGAEFMPNLLYCVVTNP